MKKFFKNSIFMKSYIFQTKDINDIYKKIFLRSSTFFSKDDRFFYPHWAFNVKVSLAKIAQWGKFQIIYRYFKNILFKFIVVWWCRHLRIYLKNIKS